MEVLVGSDVEETKPITQVNDGAEGSKSQGNRWVVIDNSGSQCNIVLRKLSIPNLVSMDYDVLAFSFCSSIMLARTVH